MLALALSFTRVKINQVLTELATEQWIYTSRGPRLVISDFKNGILQLQASDLKFLSPLVFASNASLTNFEPLADFFAGIVGEMDDKGDNLYIWTHKKFEVGYNGKQVCF